MSTITEEGKRAWIFPKKPSGKFYKYRTWVSYALLAFLLIKNVKTTPMKIKIREG